MTSNVSSCTTMSVFTETAIVAVLPSTGNLKVVRIFGWLPILRAILLDYSSRVSLDPSAQPSVQPSPKQLFLGGRTTERGVINTPPLPSTQFFVIANKRSRLDVIGQANWVCLASSKSQLNLKICWAQFWISTTWIASSTVARLI